MKDKERKFTSTVKNCLLDAVFPGAASPLSLSWELPLLIARVVENRRFCREEGGVKAMRQSGEGVKANSLGD